MHGTLLIIEKRNLVGECLKALLSKYFADMNIVPLTCVHQANPFSFSSVRCVLTSDMGDLPQLGCAFPVAGLVVTHDGRGAAPSGAAGNVPVLPLDMPAEAFVHAIRVVMRSAAAIGPSEPVPSLRLDEPRDDCAEASTGLLSGREREVHAALRRGLSNKIIAAELDLSENTVKIHVRNVLRKLGATNRTMAALHGAATGRAAIVLS